MSLETELAELREATAELREAVKENSELLKFLTSAARGGLTGKEESKPAKATAAAKEEPKKPATRSRAAAKKEKVPTTKDMADATKAFLEVDDEGEYKDRRALVKDIVDHFGVGKMSEIEEDDRQKALGMLETYKNGDDPFEGVGEDDSKDDDLA